MAAFDSGTMTITGGEEPERLSGEIVAQPYFDLLGVRPRSAAPSAPRKTRCPCATP